MRMHKSLILGELRKEFCCFPFVLPPMSSIMKNIRRSLWASIARKALTLLLIWAGSPLASSVPPHASSPVKKNRSEVTSQVTFQAVFTFRQYTEDSRAVNEDSGK